MNHLSGIKTTSKQVHCLKLYAGILAFSNSYCEKKLEKANTFWSVVICVKVKVYFKKSCGAC